MKTRRDITVLLSDGAGAWSREAIERRFWSNVESEGGGAGSIRLWKARDDNGMSALYSHDVLTRFSTLIERDGKAVV